MATGKRAKKTKAKEHHTQKAFTDIRQMMFHKDIVPGQKISSRDLAERLGMSPTPVIQALKWLEIQRLVRHEPNRGYFMEPFSLEEVTEIYELREVLELALLPDAIKYLNAEGRRRLKEALDAHLNAMKELYLNERMIKDMEFHLTLASLARGKLKVQMLRNLYELLCFKYRGNFLPVSSLESTESEHQEIYEAVAARDLPRAREVLFRHISSIKTRVLENLKHLMEEKESKGFYNHTFKI